MSVISQNNERNETLAVPLRSCLKKSKGQLGERSVTFADHSQSFNLETDVRIEAAAIGWHVSTLFLAGCAAALEILKRANKEPDSFVLMKATYAGAKVIGTSLGFSLAVIAIWDSFASQQQEDNQIIFCPSGQGSS